MDIFSVKFLFLAIVALVVLGPDKLPGALRTGGRFLSEFRRITAQAQEHSRTVLEETGLSQPLAELRSIGEAVTAPVSSLRTELYSNLRLSPTETPGTADQVAKGTEAVATSSIAGTSPVGASPIPALPTGAGEDTQESLELVWP